MKKKLLVLFLFASTASFAQIRAGALIGGNMMTVKSSEDLIILGEEAEISSVPSLHLGVLFSIPISDKAFLQPGLNYQQKGCKLTANGSRAGHRSDVISWDFKGDLTLHYLELPVNISFPLETGGGGGGGGGPFFLSLFGWA